MTTISPSKSAYKKSKTSIGWKTGRGDIYLLCPFHKEKWPSCVVHAKTSNYFICYGCGKTGGIRWLSRVTKIDFRGKTLNDLDNPAFGFYYDINQVPEMSPDSDTAPSWNGSGWFFLYSKVYIEKIRMMFISIGLFGILLICLDGLVFIA